MKHSTTSFIDQAKSLRARLFRELRTAREQLSLTQEDLSKRLGVSRVTVHRLESESADPQLSTFLGLALACGLKVSLQEDDEKASVDRTDPRRLKHRGLAHIRTQHDLDWRDRQREKALAKAWEAANKHQDVGLQPIMPALIPNCTQDQATACATVVQWLGSEVGFAFLTQALNNAGYEVVDRKEAGSLHSRNLSRRPETSQ